MMNRRTLLSSILLSRLAPAIAMDKPFTKQKVIIVGAGVAGLAAAVALRTSGMEVVIVEARNRIGGRIYTSMHWPEMPVDIGASWIHGTQGNPMTALARAAGAGTVSTSYESTLLHIDPTLKALGVKNRGTKAAESLVDRALAWAETQDRDVSLQTALDNVASFSSLKSTRQAQLDFHVSSTYEQEYSGGSEQLSAWSMDEGEEFDGDDALFPGGYGQIIAFLAEGIDTRLNHEVKSIEVRPTSAVVTFAEGTSLEADHILVTVPLGVLKAQKITFEPPLSAPKQRAISRLGMGLLNKHWLRFDRVRWPKNHDWHEYLSVRKGEWSQWVSLAKVRNTPLLLTFSAAQHAERIEQLGDDETVSDIMKTARQMFGRHLPDPVSAQISRWRSDPHAMGSYSYYATGSDPEDRMALARSEGRRLHFAGEAQSTSHPGTVHGALISGREAAARIIAGTAN